MSPSDHADILLRLESKIFASGKLAKSIMLILQQRCWMPFKKERLPAFEVFCVKSSCLCVMVKRKTSTTVQLTSFIKLR